MEHSDNLYPKCICCHETPDAGITGGIVVWGRFVCDECQSGLVMVEFGAPLYDRMLEAVKDLWSHARQRSLMPPLSRRAGL